MKEKICKYRDRLYSVREDGSILRHAKDGCRPSKLDEVWTFGKKDDKTGYMFHGNVRVHQIVATAFHGEPQDPYMVVDHKDTNRCNNRPENLQWVTRLENALNNPITRHRIELLCGGIDAFLKDPSILRESASEPNTKWMRTVSKEEAAKCLKNLTRWAEEDKEQEKKAESTGLGEWVFGDRKDDFKHGWETGRSTRTYRSDYRRQMEEIEELNRKYREEMFGLKPSLTPNAYQLNWKIPSEFPLCPQAISDTPLKDYLANLTAGSLFVHNTVYESPVYKAEMNAEGNLIAVLCTTDNGVTSFALSEVTFDGEHFIHESIRTFFTEEGAEKYYTLSLGREWKGDDVLEDFC